MSLLNIKISENLFFKFFLSKLANKLFPEQVMPSTVIKFISFFLYYQKFFYLISFFYEYSLNHNLGFFVQIASILKLLFLR